MDQFDIGLMTGAVLMMVLFFFFTMGIGVSDRAIQAIAGTAVAVTWIAGTVLAAGWLKLVAIFMPPFARYLVIERAMALAGITQGGA